MNTPKPEHELARRGPDWWDYHRDLLNVARARAQERWRALRGGVGRETNRVLEQLGLHEKTGRADVAAHAPPSPSIERIEASAPRDTHDPRDPHTGQRLSTPVRLQQHGDERCTAFAVAAAMETWLMRRGLVQRDFELSVDNLFQRAERQRNLEASVDASGSAGVIDVQTGTNWRGRWAVVTEKGEVKINVLCRRLARDEPVAVFFPIRTNWHRYDGTMPYEPVGPGDGFHAVCVVGFENGAWIVKNSGGTSWGEHGYGRLPWRHPKLDAARIAYVLESVREA